jgi:hypothetical protein
MLILTLVDRSFCSSYAQVYVRGGEGGGVCRKTVFQQGLRPIQLYAFGLCYQTISSFGLYLLVNSSELRSPLPRSIGKLLRVFWIWIGR